MNNMPSFLYIMAAKAQPRLAYSLLVCSVGVAGFRRVYPLLCVGRKTCRETYEATPVPLNLLSGVGPRLAARENEMFFHPFLCNFSHRLVPKKETIAAQEVLADDHAVYCV
jgi:hypothetical protein